MQGTQRTHRTANRAGAVATTPRIARGATLARGTALVSHPRVSESSIPVWLALIAIASLLQVLMLVTAVVIVARSLNRMQALATDIRREQITPLVARATHVINEVQDVTTRVRGYEHEFRRAVNKAGDRVHQMSDFVRVGSSPLVGLVRGASAALQVLVNGRNGSRAHGAGGTGHVQ
jgi:hypothetical protein